MSADDVAAGRGGGQGRGGEGRDRLPASRLRHGDADDGPREPCLRCGVPLPLRQMGCKGGHCPNCGHPYPHGDCSD